MLLQPDTVRFGTRRWSDALTVAIDRSAITTAIDTDDDGPHPVFADVTEQHARIRVLRVPRPGEPHPLLPGTEATLVIDVSPAGSGAGKTRLRAQAVLIDVAHDLSHNRPARQTITLLAIATSGADDPIEISTPAPEPYG